MKYLTSETVQLTIESTRQESSNLYNELNSNVPSSSSSNLSAVAQPIEECTVQQSHPENAGNMWSVKDAKF